MFDQATEPLTQDKTKVNILWAFRLPVVRGIFLMFPCQSKHCPIVILETISSQPFVIYQTLQCVLVAFCDIVLNFLVYGEDQRADKRLSEAVSLQLQIFSAQGRRLDNSTKLRPVLLDFRYARLLTWSHAFFGSTVVWLEKTPIERPLYRLVRTVTSDLCLRNSSIEHEHSSKRIVLNIFPSTEHKSCVLSTSRKTANIPRQSNHHCDGEYG
jgi:hypothetical protein